MDDASKKHPFITLQELPSSKTSVVADDHAPNDKILLKPANLSKVLRSWVFEIIGWLVATICILAAMFILFAFNHHPLRTLPFKIKLTTALSVLANVVEASIAMLLAACLSQTMWMRFSRQQRPLADIAMFDAASRGPFGGLLLLIQNHKSIKGYAGAVIGLLALAIGPFFQEAISYVPINGPASLQRCESTIFSSFAGAMYNVLHTDIAANDMYTNGLLDQTLQELNRNCSSGNCTWPTFSSLGICSHCLNVTDQVKTACGPVQDVVSGNVTGCTTVLDDDVFVNNYTDYEHGKVNIAMAYFDGSPQWDTFGDAGIYDFSMIRHSKNNVVHANDCMLYYCVRAYNSTVQANILKENVVATWYGVEAESVDNVYYTDPVTGIIDGPNSNQVFSPPRHEWSTLNLTKATNFTADWFTTSQLFTWLSTTLNGTGYVKYNNTGTTSGDYIVDQVYDNLWGATNQDVGALFEGITQHMSDKVRGLCSTDDSVLGTAIDVATVLDASWAWFAYPGLVVLAAGVYLVFIMVESRHHHSMIWKAGVLPLLFHGVSVEVEKVLSDGPVDDLKTMRQQARTVKVKMQRSDIGGWHFHGEV